MRIFKAALLYLALVFGAGFVLGTIRTLWIVPRFGVRIAELMEMPLMLLVSIFSARGIVQRFALPPTLVARVGMGLIALTLLLTLEFTLVLWLRQISISEYFETSDPVSGAVYYFMLLLFALLPLWVARKVRKPSLQ